MRWPWKWFSKRSDGDLTLARDLEYCIGCLEDAKSHLSSGDLKYSLQRINSSFYDIENWLRNLDSLSNPKSKYSIKYIYDLSKSASFKGTKVPEIIHDLDRLIAAMRELLGKI